jgi:hypothetical protein
MEKDKALTKEIAEQLIIDATEQPMQRPKNKKKQRQYYSGKKKKRAIKKQIIIDDKGKIKQISKSYEGKKHDFSIFKDKKNLKTPTLTNRNITMPADSGCQGINKYKTNAESPVKRHKIRDPMTNNIITPISLFSPS